MATNDPTNAEMAQEIMNFILRQIPDAQGFYTIATTGIDEILNRCRRIIANEADKAENPNLHYLEEVFDPRVTSGRKVKRTAIIVREITDPIGVFDKVIDLLGMTQQASGMRPVVLEIGSPLCFNKRYGAGIECEKFRQRFIVGETRLLHKGFRLITERLVAIYANGALVLNIHEEGQVSTKLVKELFSQFGTVCPVEEDIDQTPSDVEE